MEGEAAATGVGAGPGLGSAAPTGGEVDYGVVATVVVSCMLSVLGSSAIILSYFLFTPMRQKQGCELLMYLSIADLLSAVVYAFSMMPPAWRGTGDWFCKTQALLGMLFPIASFMWTNLIAWFLWRMVNDGLRVKKLVWYHIIAWGVPALMVALVAAFDEEGSPDSHSHGIPTGRADSTGGWCWIRGTGKGGPTLLWVLLGGKLVEWPSIVLFVPGFYILVHRRVTTQLQVLHIKPGAMHEWSPYGNRGRHSVSQSSGGRGERGAGDSPGSRPVSSSGAMWDSTEHPGPGPGRSSTAVTSNSGEPRRENSHRDVAERAQQQRLRTGVALSEFSRKLVAVPLVFGLARLWGNVHIILWLLFPSRPSLPFLVYTQAFFDPSQGFFNGLIFVLLSRDVRALFGPWCFRKFGCGCCRPRPNPEAQRLIEASSEGSLGMA